MKFSERPLLKHIPSLFLRHIGGVILCWIFLIPASGSLAKTSGQIIWSIIFLFIYSIPLYVALWSIGHQDLNSYKFGHMEKDPLKGFKLGLIFSIPAFIMAVLFILSKFDLFPNFVVLFKFLNAEILPFMNLIKNTLYMPYLNLWQTFGIALLTLIPAILCGAFYQIGFHDFTPSHWVIYKQDKSEKKIDAPDTK